MKQSTRAERLGARVLYEWGLMNIAEIARDTGRSQKTIHEWKKTEGWIHPDDQPVLDESGLARWPDALDVAEAGLPEHQRDRPQGPAVSTSENPIAVADPTEEAHQTSNPELRAELEAAHAKRDALQAELAKYKLT